MCFFFFNELKKCDFAHLFWAVLGLCRCVGSSLVAASRAHSPVAVPGLPLQRLLWKERGPQGTRASVVVVRGFSGLPGKGPAACWIFPGQGSNSCLLQWQADSLPGKPPDHALLTIKCNVEIRHSQRISEMLASVLLHSGTTVKSKKGSLNTNTTLPGQPI